MARYTRPSHFRLLSQFSQTHPTTHDNVSTSTYEPPIQPSPGPSPPKTPSQPPPHNPYLFTAFPPHINPHNNINSWPLPTDTTNNPDLTYTYTSNLCINVLTDPDYYFSNIRLHSPPGHYYSYYYYYYPNLCFVSFTGGYHFYYRSPNIHVIRHIGSANCYCYSSSIYVICRSGRILGITNESVIILIGLPIHDVTPHVNSS